MNRFLSNSYHRCAYPTPPIDRKYDSVKPFRFQLHFVFSYKKIFVAPMGGGIRSKFGLRVFPIKDYILNHLRWHLTLMHFSPCGRLAIRMVPRSIVEEQGFVTLHSHVKIKVHVVPSLLFGRINALHPLQPFYIGSFLSYLHGTDF